MIDNQVCDEGCIMYMEFGDRVKCASNGRERMKASCYVCSTYTPSLKIGRLSAEELDELTTTKMPDVSTEV